MIVDCLNVREQIWLFIEFKLLPMRNRTRAEWGPESSHIIYVCMCGCGCGCVCVYVRNKKCAEDVSRG